MTKRFKRKSLKPIPEPKDKVCHIVVAPSALKTSTGILFQDIFLKVRLIQQDEISRTCRENGRIQLRGPQIRHADNGAQQNTKQRLQSLCSILPCRPPVYSI